MAVTISPGSGMPDLLQANVDAAVLAYIGRAQPAFDLLRQAAGQLAGLLVLAAAGSRAAVDHPMLGSARGSLDEATERLRLAQPPQSARHHHHHLVEAATLTALALDNAEAGMRRLGGENDVGPAIEPLKAAHRHLQWAAAALPGFEIVAFEQGCCAAHPAVRGMPKRRRAIECARQ